LPSVQRRVPVTADPIKFEPAIRAFEKRVPITRDEWDKLDKSEREFAFTVSGATQADLVTQVYEAIDKAVETGSTFEEFKAGSFVDELYDAWGGESPSRLEMVFRTGVNQAYNDGREAVFRQPAVADLRPIWRYERGGGEDCDICDECEGVILPADDPWWNDHRPLMHPNCVCSFSALTKDEAAEEGYVAADDEDAPDVDAADGFGDSDEEWSPDLSNYPDEIAEILGRVLDR
jgi:uncharacterized protein with gpF-like domain